MHLDIINNPLAILAMLMLFFNKMFANFTVKFHFLDHLGVVFWEQVRFVEFFTAARAKFSGFVKANRLVAGHTDDSWDRDNLLALGASMVIGQ